MAGHTLTTHSLRPKRFDLHTPVRYRHAGSSNWHKGTSQNVSCSGVLFKGRHAMKVYEPIEVEMQLPPQITGDTPVFLYCRGYVARIVEPKLPFAKPGLAATFLDYKVRYATKAGKEIAPVVDPAASDFRHLMNNMLAAVIGNAELILSEPQNEFVQQCATRIKDAAEHAAAELNRRTEGKT